MIPTLSLLYCAIPKSASSAIKRFLLNAHFRPVGGGGSWQLLSFVTYINLDPHGTCYDSRDSITSGRWQRALRLSVTARIRLLIKSWHLLTVIFPFVMTAVLQPNLWQHGVLRRETPLHHYGTLCHVYVIILPLTMNSFQQNLQSKFSVRVCRGFDV